MRAHEQRQGECSAAPGRVPDGEFLRFRRGLIEWLCDSVDRLSLHRSTFHTASARAAAPPPLRPDAPRPPARSRCAPPPLTPPATARPRRRQPARQDAYADEPLARGPAGPRLRRLRSHRRQALRGGIGGALPRVARRRVRRALLRVRDRADGDHGAHAARVGHPLQHRLRLCRRARPLDAHPRGRRDRGRLDRPARRLDAVLRGGRPADPQVRRLLRRPLRVRVPARQPARLAPRRRRRRRRAHALWRDADLARVHAARRRLRPARAARHALPPAAVRATCRRRRAQRRRAVGSARVQAAGPRSPPAPRLRPFAALRAEPS